MFGSVKTDMVFHADTLDFPGICQVPKLIHQFDLWCIFPTHVVDASCRRLLCVANAIASSQISLNTGSGGSTGSKSNQREKITGTSLIPSLSL